MDTNLLPTEFTPTQLEILRALVASAQSKRATHSPELHNLASKLDGYVGMARAAHLPLARAS